MIETAAMVWALGMVGVTALAIRGLPMVLEGRRLGRPLAVVQALAGLQSAVLVGLMSALGAWAAPQVGLGIPLVEAALDGALTGKVVTTFFGGGAAGALGMTLVMTGLARLTPPGLRGAKGRDMPLVVKLTYGGITEEVLLRWGVMSALALLIATISGDSGPLSMGMAVVVSALLFGVGHLPYAKTVSSSGLSSDVVRFVVLGNTAVGLVLGTVYWLCGLEAAMAAHAGGHAVFSLMVAPRLAERA